jgi:ATP-dependent Clp protease protease subunit
MKKSRQVFSKKPDTLFSVNKSEAQRHHEDDDEDFLEGYRMSDTKDYLNSNGIYHLCGDVNRASAEEVVEWIIAHNIKEKKVPYLTLIVTSHGGTCDHSFAITDMIMGSSIPVRTVGLGVIASCGLMIFMAGQKGERVLTPNCSILSHQFSGGDWGKQHELVAGRMNMDLTGDKIMRHYKRCTGLTEKKINEKLLPPQDVWLSAEEAKKLGICDQIKLVT